MISSSFSVHIMLHSSAVAFASATRPKSMLISMAAHQNVAAVGKKVLKQFETKFHFSLCTWSSLK